MIYWRNKVKIFILCTFLLFPLSTINAAQTINNNLLEFSLALSKSETYFNFYSTTYKTSSKKWGINWYESFSDYFHAGLELGNIEMNQVDNPLPSSQYTSGEYAGLLLRFLPITTPTFALTFNLNYRYNRAQGESTNQLTEFTWDETLLLSQVNFRPIENFILFLAADYQVLSGEQRVSGNVTKVTSFKENEHYGYRFGLNFITNRTGTVGVEWFSGFNSGTKLYFSRKF